MILSLIGCTRDNPAFDDCDSPEGCLAEDSGTGDGDPGDGDPSEGDGDGEPSESESDGDGDGEPGDGDGDGDDPNMLPACPETKKLELQVVKDTFLVAAPEESGICVVGWDFQLWQPKLSDTQMPCEVLMFGGTPLHWVCNSDGCQSVWLGRFNVGGYAEQAPKVTNAQIEFWSQVDAGETNQLTLHPLIVEPTVFGQCGDWSPGGGTGDPVTDCKTTWTHSAYPNLWQLDGLLGNAEVLSAAAVPAGELFDHHVVLPIASHVVEGWFTNNPLHIGVALRSQSWAPTEFMLYAQESTTPPKLVVDVCSQL